MYRSAIALVLWLCSLPLFAQDLFYQKCYGSGLVLLTNVRFTAGTVEVAVRNIIPPEGTAIDDPLAGKLVFRTVTPMMDFPGIRTAVTVVMRDVEAYAMENPYTTRFSGPAIAYLGWNRRGIKGTLTAEISDRRDPTDDLSPSIIQQFDTIKLTFVPETSPLPYQLEWEGIVWKGDLIVFERWVR